MPTTIEFNWPRKQKQESASTLMATLRGKHLAHLAALALPYAGVAVSEVWIVMRLQTIVEQSLGDRSHAEGANAALAGGIGWIFALLLGAIVLARILEAVFAKRTRIALRQEYLKLALHADEGVWRKQSTVSRLNSFIHLLDQAVQGYYVGQYQLLFVVFQILAGVLLAAWVSPYLILIAVVLLILFQVLMGLLFPLVEAALERYIGASNHFIQILREQVLGAQMIRNFCAKNRFYQLFHRKNMDLAQAEVALDRRVAGIQVVSQLLFSLSLFGLVYFLARLVQAGTLAKTDILFIFSSLAVFLIPGFMLIQSLPQIKTAGALLQHLSHSFTEEAIPIVDPDPADASVYLGLRAVSFSYPPTESFEIQKPKGNRGLQTVEEQQPVSIFSEQSISIRKNEKVLLIGPSGSGKSTLLRLFARFLRTGDGLVLLKGQNILAWDEAKIRETIQYLEQEVFLLDATLRENLDPAGVHSDREILECMQALGLNSLLSSAGNTNGDSSNVLDGRKVLDSGINVSGGERTRIALARSLLAKPEILLLDEVFAGLDNARAQEIESLLLGIDNCTMIHSSHALFASNLSRYDAVYQIVEGVIHRLSEEEIQNIPVIR